MQRYTVSGIHVPDSFALPSQDIVVTFYSDSAVHGNGFNFTWTAGNIYAAGQHSSRLLYSQCAIWTQHNGLGRSSVPQMCYRIPQIWRVYIALFRRVTTDKGSSLVWRSTVSLECSVCKSQFNKQQYPLSIFRRHYIWPVRDWSSSRDDTNHPNLHVYIASEYHPTILSKFGNRFRNTIYTYI